MEMVMAAIMICKEAIPDPAYRSERVECSRELLNCVEKHTKQLDSDEYKKRELMKCFLKRKN